MDVYSQIAIKIIKSQENIIGPVAVEQAKKVHNIKLNWDKQELSISGDEADAIDSLIDIYKNLFGQISVEVSKEAAASLINKLGKNQIPEALK